MDDLRFFFRLVYSYLALLVCAWNYKFVPMAGALTAQINTFTAPLLFAFGLSSITNTIIFVSLFTPPFPFWPEQLVHGPTLSSSIILLQVLVHPYQENWHGSSRSSLMEGMSHDHMQPQNTLTTVCNIVQVFWLVTEITTAANVKHLYGPLEILVTCADIWLKQEKLIGIFSDCNGL